MNRSKFKNIALYGGGQLCKMTLDIWPKNLPLPKIIVDQYKLGHYKNIKIISPKEFKKISKNYNLFLCAFKIKSNKISSLFKNLNQELFTSYDILNFFSKKTFSNGWNSKITRDKLIKIKKIKKIWNDKNSLNSFNAIINWRYKRKLDKFYPVYTENNKYLNFLKKKNKINLIDCGQYDWQLFNKIKKKINIKEYFGIEPSIKRIKKIKSNRNFNNKKYTLFNLALSNNSKKQLFVNDGQLCARIINSRYKIVDKLRFVNCTELKNVFKKIKDKKIETIIKIHIEGREYQVIKSSIKSLKNENVSFMINLSHDESSLIKLPLLLHKAGFYNQKIYNHSLFGEGITLYAWK